MGLHLLNGLNRQLKHPVVLGSDSQAVLKALQNQRSHAGQYILDNIHKASEQLHTKQDALINREECDVMIKQEISGEVRIKE
jgi:hypothetical protein